MITAEQFSEWKTHPVTKEIFTGLKELKLTLTNQLTEGSFTEYGAEYAYGMLNKIIGQIAGIDQILNISYEDEKVDSGNVDSKSSY